MVLLATRLLRDSISVRRFDLHLFVFCLLTWGESRRGMGGREVVSYVQREVSLIHLNYIECCLRTLQYHTRLVAHAYKVQDFNEECSRAYVHKKKQNSRNTMGYGWLKPTRFKSWDRRCKDSIFCLKIYGMTGRQAFNGTTNSLLTPHATQLPIKKRRNAGAPHVFLTAVLHDAVGLPQVVPSEVRHGVALPVEIVNELQRGLQEVIGVVPFSALIFFSQAGESLL